MAHNFRELKGMRSSACNSLGSKTDKTATLTEGEGKATNAVKTNTLARQ